VFDESGRDTDSSSRNSIYTCENRSREERGQVNSKERREKRRENMSNGERERITRTEKSE
jgi:hypothetical protein